ncbi:MAG TPA: hypothetical protein VFQ61_03470, partial [Polyangiaceae bacterium]|nr:hypothetical protein [Polyangiaceae bacterium]
MRSVIPANVVRSDTTLAYYEGTNGRTGSTIASTLLASMKLSDEFAAFARFAAVSNSPPSGEPGSSFVNPILGGLYGVKLGSALRFAATLGVALPLGNGGGNTPNAQRAAANAAGIRARSAMDNALFAVNDLVLFPGVDLAFIQGGFTAQIEATLLQLTRVRGEDKQPDSSRTNFTSGVHVGYFLIPELSLGVELRHQRWLSTPKAVSAAPATRDTTTFAVGPRVHLKLAEKVWL